MQEESVQTALNGLVTERPELLEDWRLCEALLRDRCPREERGINLLVDALREGVPLQLKKASGTTPLEALGWKLTRLLHKRRGIEAGLAGWAVETWARALGRGPLRLVETVPDRHRHHVTAGRGRTMALIAVPCALGVALLWLNGSNRTTSVIDRRASSSTASYVAPSPQPVPPPANSAVMVEELLRKRPRDVNLWNAALAKWQAGPKTDSHAVVGLVGVRNLIDHRQAAVNPSDLVSALNRVGAFQPDFYLELAETASAKGDSSIAIAILRAGAEKWPLEKLLPERIAALTGAPAASVSDEAPPSPQSGSAVAASNGDKGQTTTPPVEITPARATAVTPPIRNAPAPVGQVRVHSSAFSVETRIDGEIRGRGRDLSIQLPVGRHNIRLTSADPDVIYSLVRDVDLAASQLEEILVAQLLSLQVYSSDDPCELWIDDRLFDHTPRKIQAPTGSSFQVLFKWPALHKSKVVDIVMDPGRTRLQVDPPQEKR